MRHGSPSGYNYWKCRCDACRAKNAEKSARFRANHVEVGAIDPVTGRFTVPGAPHGSAGGYSNYGCRCDDCAEAFSA